MFIAGLLKRVDRKLTKKRLNIFIPLYLPNVKKIGASSGELFDAVRD